MTSDNFVKSELALLSWREERSNGVNGCSAVMFVVRNRVKAGWFGGDWLRNMAAHGQFSSMTILGDSQTIAFPDIRDPEFQKILNVVDSIYDDSVPDNLTDGALYYADLSSPAYHKGGWFDTAIVANPEHPRLAQVGSTTYFR